MMRNYLVAFFFLLTAFISNAQISAEYRNRLEGLLSSYTDAKKDKNFRKAFYYFGQENHDSTIVYSSRYISSPKSGRQLKDFAYYFRGRAFREKGLLAEAAKDYTRISKTFELSALIRSEQADLLYLDADFKKAQDIYLSLSEEYSDDIPDIEMSVHNHKIGLCSMMLEDYEKAEKFLLMAIEEQQKENDIDKLTGSYGDLANVYYEQYLDDQAIAYFTKAYDLAKQSEDFDLKLTTAGNMAIVEENRGNLEKSIEYLKEQDQWKDSLYNQQKIWEVAQIEKKHIAETKQREIGLLQRENNLKSQQRNVILVGAAVLLIVLLLIVYFYWQKIRSSAIIAEQRESLDKLNAFKNRLFSIVSHDLRSSVNGLRRSTEQLRGQLSDQDSSLKSLVNQQGAMANSTFGLLDNLLNWALLQSDEIYFHPEKVSLKRLLPQVILNYQPLLDQKNIDLETDLPAEAKILADIDSVKIVLRNVLDNAIKFTPEGGIISITAEVGESNCVLRIKDNGNGMTAEQLKILREQSSKVSRESADESSGTGLGTRLCTSFMLKNQGAFDVESMVNHGTTVILTFQKA